MKRLALCMCFIYVPLEAKVLEDQGTTFAIREESLLSVLERRLASVRTSGRWSALEEDFKKRVVERVWDPVPVAGVSKTREARQFYYDPSFTVQEDIKDVQGRLIQARGKKFNPLEVVSWGEPLLLIQGDDAAQVSWALAQQGKITLVTGSPLRLQESHQRSFYFDQGGTIVKRFHIRQVPARIIQAGKKLLIEEIVP